MIGTTVARILLASFLGGMIGLEREMKGRPAGLKTFSLVCIGASLVMITNEYISVRLGYGGDIARMPAQIISGIGFLGAGTIMVTGQNRIKGLTTAAALWVTASIGIAVGMGYYCGAIMTVVIVYVTSCIYRVVDAKIVESSRIMRIYIEGTEDEILLRLLDYLKENKIRVGSLVRRPENMWSEKDTCAIIEILFPERTNHSQVLEQIQELKGIIYVEELRS